MNKYINWALAFVNLGVAMYCLFWENDVTAAAAFLGCSMAFKLEAQK